VDIEKQNMDMSLEKTKYMLMSRYQKAGQKHSREIANRSFEDGATFQISGNNTNR
jgi:hypothetical protein